MFANRLSKSLLVNKVKLSKSFLSTYPAFIVNAPLTEVSKTSNGVRVASEVITFFLKKKFSLL